MPLRHRISFTMVGQRAELIDEAVENERPTRQHESDVYFYYRYQRGHPVVNIKTEKPGPDGRARRDLRREDLPHDQSVLSQRQVRIKYPEVMYLGTNTRRSGSCANGIWDGPPTPETTTHRSSRRLFTTGCRPQGTVLEGRSLLRNPQNNRSSQGSDCVARSCGTVLHHPGKNLQPYLNVYAAQIIVALLQAIDRISGRLILLHEVVLHAHRLGRFQNSGEIE